MNEKIIRNWNSRVTDDDIVYHLGDFLFRNSPGGKPGEGLPEKPVKFTNRLNGIIIHVKGNHDKTNSVKTIIDKIYVRFSGSRICMTHRPEDADPRCDFNLVGHIHTEWKFKDQFTSVGIGRDELKLINVGVDVWGFRPVLIEEALKEYKRWSKGRTK